jgi:CRISPR/Cas system CSM-associated protein Csm3 (group 7 of RAMP superfamily)
MTDITYKITFFSNWHCGSGLAAGADTDALVIKDRDGLPYVPGRTIKGLLREAVVMLQQFSDIPEESITRLFGQGGDSDGFGCRSDVSFTNATLKENERLTILDSQLTDGLFVSVTATAIGEDGIAIDHSLRKIETTIPCTLHGTIINVTEDDIELLTRAFKWIKRLGLGRNRGYGRCEIIKED